MPEPIEPVVTPQDPTVMPPADPTPEPTAPPVEPANPDNNNQPSDDDDDSSLLGVKKDGKVGDKVVPEKYEFKLPEGFELDEETLGVFAPVFKELNLDNEQAQKLVDAYAPTMEKMGEKLKEQFDAEAKKAFKEIVGGWKSETIKELGAESEAKLSLADKAVEKIGSPELREALDNTGLGSHKAFVNMMIKVGEILGEDTLVEGSGPTDSSEEAKLKKMYPTMN